MVITQPVPWGRTLAEYRAMMALDSADDGKRVLDVAAGPASFTAEWVAAGGCAVACDPLYAADAAAIDERLAGARDTVGRLMVANAARFVWRTFASPDELHRARLVAADRFRADFTDTRIQGRYVAAALPRLPFADGAFHLGLCSHFLFLYSEALSAEFHVTALIELARVADEVRVFPLLTLEGKPSPYVSTVIAALRGLGWRAVVEQVSYEVLWGGNEMLRLNRTRCL